jgi:hypothetical protein
MSSMGLDGNGKKAAIIQAIQSQYSADEDWFENNVLTERENEACNKHYYLDISPPKQTTFRGPVDGRRLPHTSARSSSIES